MGTYDYWKANKDRQELEQWKDELTRDIKMYIDASFQALKADLKAELLNITVNVETYLNGNRTNLEGLKNDITRQVIKLINN